MIRRDMAFVALLLTIAGFAAGCSKSGGGTTLATVGDYKITAAEFKDYYLPSSKQFATADEEFADRRAKLDSLIVKRLFVQAAYDKGIDKSEELARVVLANKEKFLLDVLYQREIADKSVPTAAEVRAFYNNLQYKVRAYHILVEDLDTAKMIRQRLMDGENFEKLAYKYSIDPSAKRNRGDLGYFTWGTMVPEFEKAVFAMKVGEISQPVKTEYGYHIIKLIDRLPNDQRFDFESMRPDIEHQLLNQKRQQLAMDYFKYIKQKYAITVDTSICDYLIHKREALYPPLLLKTLPRGDFDLDQLDRDEKELVLATWDGGQMTVLQYLEKIKDWPQERKPAFDDYKGIADAVFNVDRIDLLAQEAYRQGLDNDPEFVRRMKLFRELTMADIMRNDSLPAPEAPPEDSVRAYYDEHIDQYTTPAKIHVFEILLSDEMQAQNLKKNIHSLSVFKEKAMDLTERSGKRASAGDLGYIERRWFPEIFDAANKLGVGEIGGPVVTGGRYSIFYVADKLEPAVKDYLEVKPQITQLLQRQAKQDVVTKWIDARKKKVDINVDKDALWSTIDVDKYHATAPTEAQKPGS
jgi:peptidyl-prolyl cis-trans isomerase C